MAWCPVIGSVEVYILQIDLPSRHGDQQIILNMLSHMRKMFSWPVSHHNSN